jgi:hypothetical protein
LDLRIFLDIIETATLFDALGKSVKQYRGSFFLGCVISGFFHIGGRVVGGRMCVNEDSRGRGV